MTNIYTENQHRIFQHKDGRESNPVTNVLPGMNPESMMTQGPPQKLNRGPERKVEGSGIAMTGQAFKKLRDFDISLT